MAELEVIVAGKTKARHELTASLDSFMAKRGITDSDSGLI